MKRRFFRSLYFQGEAGGHRDEGIADGGRGEKGGEGGEELDAETYCLPGI